MEKYRLSIIVPVLNEAAQIRPFLRHLRLTAPGAEIVVTDGGSIDRTLALAEDFSDVLISTTRGRAHQMNAGVEAARGDMLWFVHVDCEAPVGAGAAVVHALGDAGSVGGCFRVTIPDRRRVFRIHDCWAHWIGKCLRVRCGDHGIFCTKAAFAKAGGYPDVPLMEDVELVRALHRIGSFAWLDERLTLSTRRHRQVGPYWYTFVCASVVALYCAGIRRRPLANIYQALVAPRTELEKRRPLPPVEDVIFSKTRNEQPEADGAQNLSGLPHWVRD